jgi:hypothetical protein
MHNGNYPGGQMNKFGWKGLSNRYYAATGLLHDREQLQGKQRTLKKLWRFCNLARSHTSLAIDAEGFIHAPKKWWNDNTTVIVRSTKTFPFTK